VELCIGLRALDGGGLKEEGVGRVSESKFSVCRRTANDAPIEHSSFALGIDDEGELDVAGFSCTICCVMFSLFASSLSLLLISAVDAPNDVVPCDEAVLSEAGFSPCFGLSAIPLRHPAEEGSLLSTSSAVSPARPDRLRVRCGIVLLIVLKV
jgi:hypothetical protein